jgi:hypothetical protein
MCGRDATGKIPVEGNMIDDVVEYRARLLEDVKKTIPDVMERENRVAPPPVMQPRVCVECGKTFVPRSTRKVCPECSCIRDKERARVRVQNLGKYVFKPDVILAWMEENHVTRTQIAIFMCRSVNTVGQWIRGDLRKCPSKWSVDKMAKFMGMAPDDIAVYRADLARKSIATRRLEKSRGVSATSNTSPVVAGLP